MENDMKKFMLNGKCLEHGSPCYFIADIAANHDGDLDRAIDLIHLAKEAGADCAKFQHFEADKIVSDTGFNKIKKIETHQSSWQKSVSEVYDQYHTKREWTDKLISECAKAEIDFMTTPYDLEAVVEFSNKMSAFKIGSGDITFAPILSAIAATKKSVFLATGAADIDDVDRAMSFFPENPVCIMQCNTNYTGDLENFKYVNLNVLKLFSVKYPNHLLGFSDHTPGHSAVLCAVALGAVAVEKHFTDDNNRIGPDHSFALNPYTWREMVDRTRELELAMGDGVKRIEENEKNTIIVQRRSIRIKKDLKQDSVLELKHLNFLRPCGLGEISPMDLNKILGKKIKKSLSAGEALKWCDLQD